MKVLLIGKYPDFVIKGIRKKAELVHLTQPDRKRIAKEIESTNVLIVTTKTKVDRKLLEKTENLKVVITFSHGYEHVDVETLEKMGTRFYTIPGTTASVAELTFGLMIAVLRKIPEHDRRMKRGEWKKELGHELRGKTLGVVGLGPIGREVCRIAKSFGMKVVACDPNQLLKGRVKVRMVSFDRLLRISDIITLHAHLNEETWHMIGEKEIGKMKRSAVLINTARGGLVDSEALHRALKSGRIAGAGLDVYEREPPGKDKLVRLPNVVCTPHTGADTFEGRERKGEILLEIFEKEL